jgi:hypothetical protein
MVVLEHGVEADHGDAIGGEGVADAHIHGRPCEMPLGHGIRKASSTMNLPAASAGTAERRC